MEINKKTFPRNKEANHAVQFINQLTLTGDYSGDQFKLRPFQEYMIRNLFGRVGKDGKRQIKKAAWLLPRKQGKSQLAAAVLIYALCNFPPGQQIYSVGKDRAQAAEIFNLAAQMLRQDEDLMQEYGIEIVDSQKRIVIRSQFSFYCALSKEHKGNKLGKNPSVILFDEAQELDEGMHGSLTTGMASRGQPLIIYIGTGGSGKEGIGYEIFEYAKKVEAGTITDESFLPCLWYATDEEAKENWDNPELWKRVIPALGDYQQQSFYVDEAKRAKHLPRLKNEFLRYYLNVWTSKSTSWIPDQDWMNNAGEPTSCFAYTGGVDLASVNDTSSFVLFGQNDEGTFDVLPFVWVCQRQIHERTEAEAMYQVWKDQGLLRVAGDEAQDQEIIFQDIVEICNQYNVTKIGVDRHGMNWFAPKLMTTLTADIRSVNQSMVGLSEPLKQLERLILSKKVNHGGHEMLRWMNSNARVISDGSENIRLHKKGSQRMDGIAALANAVAVYDWADQDTSIYESRGATIL